MKSSLPKVLLLTAVLVALGSAVPTRAYADPLNDFVIDQSPISSCGIAPFNYPCLLNADKLTGNYSELFTVTGPGTFSSVAYWDLGQFATNDGNNPILAPLLNNPTNFPGLLDGYAIYALFDASGTFAPSGSGFLFTGVTGSISLYVDYNVDGYTAKTLPSFAPGSVTVPGAGEDKLLATANFLEGTGSTAAGLANGNFGLLFDPFTLTALGGTVFTTPDPFYMSVLLKGQFNFNPVFPGCGPATFGTAACSGSINGTADAFFFPSEVPEPATLTLLGLGLLGAGAAARRRRKTPTA